MSYKSISHRYACRFVRQTFFLWPDSKFKNRPTCFLPLSDLLSGQPRQLHVLSTLHGSPCQLFPHMKCLLQNQKGKQFNEIMNNSNVQWTAFKNVGYKTSLCRKVLLHYFVQWHSTYTKTIVHCKSFCQCNFVNKN